METLLSRISKPLQKPDNRLVILQEEKPMVLEISEMTTIEIYQVVSEFKEIRNEMEKRPAFQGIQYNSEWLGRFITDKLSRKDKFVKEEVEAAMHEKREELKDATSVGGSTDEPRLVSNTRNLIVHANGAKCLL